MIFPGFQACPLCGFDVALGSSYGFPECFGEASGAQEVALEAPRGAREERFHAQMAPGAPDGSKLKISVLEALWLQPMRPKRYRHSGFRDSQKKQFFLLNGTSGIPGGSREGSKSGGDAPAGSQGALGKVVQVHWAPFYEVLDLQKVARA